MLAAQHVENRTKVDHKALFRVFQDVTGLPKTITEQIVKALYPVYINTLSNRRTNTIQVDVTTVIDYFFTTYGMIEPEVLREHKLKVREMDYELMDPLVTIYD